MTATATLRPMSPSTLAAAAAALAVTTTTILTRHLQSLLHLTKSLRQSQAPESRPLPTGGQRLSLQSPGSSDDDINECQSSLPTGTMTTAWAATKTMTTQTHQRRSTLV